MSIKSEKLKENLVDFHKKIIKKELKKYESRFVRISIISVKKNNQNNTEIFEFNLPRNCPEYVLNYNVGVLVDDLLRFGRMSKLILSYPEDSIITEKDS